MVFIKEYLKVGLYSPVFTVMLYIQIDQVFIANFREELAEILDFLIVGNLPLFMLLTIREYLSLIKITKSWARFYLVLLIIGSAAAILSIITDYHNFFNLERWWSVLRYYGLLAAILVPLHRAIRNWYQGKKLWFWIYIGVTVVLSISVVLGSLF